MNPFINIISSIFYIFKANYTTPLQVLQKKKKGSNNFKNPFFCIQNYLGIFFTD